MDQSESEFDRPKKKCFEQKDGHPSICNTIPPRNGQKKKSLTPVPNSHFPRNPTFPSISLTSLIPLILVKKMMRRIVGASSAIAAVSAQQRDHGFVMHLPKADIPLGKFNFSKQYNEFRNRSGRVPDFGVEKFRESFWRVDEYIRRSEKHLQEQGYFYLPTLEFPWYKGCLPLFSSYQLRVHYGRHHRAYVEKLNKLIEGTPYYGLELDDLILKSSKDAKNVAIFNNAAQHYNHCFFWKTITPHGSNMPPDLEQALNAQYGSMAEFKRLSAKARSTALVVDGSISSSIKVHNCLILFRWGTLGAR